MVQAAIDSARIIGLPKMRPPNQVVFVNELQTGPIYWAHPRKSFIREFVR